MEIVVTGGTGMVGKCIQNLVTKYPNNKFRFLSSKDCDLRDRSQVLEFFSNNTFNYIIHLAANVGGLYKNMEKNITMFSDNIKINENVLEACHKNNIKRGIFCLSSCIYPAEPSKFPMDETMIHESAPHPSNEGYAYAKRMLELQCRHYNQTYNYNYICVVPVNLYGPYDNFNLQDSHFIPGLMHRFQKQINLKNNSLPYKFNAFGTGTPLRQFLYAPDFAKLILLILFKYSGNTPIICCDDNEYTIKEMVHKVSNIMEIPTELLTWDTKKSDGCLKKTVTNKKLKRLFPEFKFTTVEKGLENTYNWFNENYDTLRK